MDELMTPPEAAAVLRCSERTLRRWRKTNAGPPYIHIGEDPRAGIRYPKSQLQEWLKNRTAGATA